MLWSLCGDQTGGWSQDQKRDDVGLDWSDGSGGQGGLDLRYRLEMDQIGIGDLDIGIKRREEPRWLPHFYVKHLGGSWWHWLRNGETGRGGGQDHARLDEPWTPLSAAHCPVWGG